MTRLLAAMILLPLLQPALALDAACEPLIKSSEAKIAQPAWHSIIASDGKKIEAIKVDGQFFMLTDGKWRKFPMDLDKAEKIAIAQMQSGGIIVSDCKDEGTEIVDGTEMNVLSYTSAIPGSGFPATSARVFIGKDDGLPYKVIDTEKDKTPVIYRYEGVVAPKL